MRGTESAPTDEPRLHGFDAVRGLAAAAVVALHAAYAHVRFPLPGLVWPVPHDRPDALADAFFWAFEGAVMPLFFTLSGYFLAASLGRRPPADVLANRTRRLLLPMATVGVAVLAVDLHVWVAGLILSGRATAHEYRRMKFAPSIQAELFGPAHLWYVEYLWLMCAGVCAALWISGRIRRKQGRSGITGVRAPSPHRNEAFRHGAAAAGLVAAIAVVLTARPQIVLGFQHGWIPNPAKFLHGALFLALGALLHRAPKLMTAVRHGTWFWIAAALIAFVALLPRIHGAMASGRGESFDPVLGGLLGGYAVATTFACLSSGERWLGRPNRNLARLAAASFWIYVAHHPILGLSAIALRPVALPPFSLAAASFLATFPLCLWSYGRFVEGRTVGRLLDGEWPWRALRASAHAAPPAIRPPAPGEVRRAA